MSTLNTPHSAHYLNDTRDLWWNADFLELVATRTGLRRVQRALDVGAGLGHWTRTVASLLSPGARITGIEREATWVERAMSTVDHAANDVVIDFVQGDVHALPWPDHTFELVTSQTVLIHVPDPAAALAEMVRVLRPGGVLLCAEPNNLGQSVSSLVGDPHFELDDVVALERGLAGGAVEFAERERDVTGFVGPGLLAVGGQNGAVGLDGFKIVAQH